MKKWYAVVLVIAASIILLVGFYAKDKDLKAQQENSVGTESSSSPISEKGEEDTTVASTSDFSASGEKGEEDTTVASTSDFSASGEKKEENTTLGSSEGTEFTELEIIDTVIEIEENQGIGGM